MLLSADWHLTDAPADEYRWRVFSLLTSKQYRGVPIYVLGDLTDRKDRHSAALVNRIVSEFAKLSHHNDCEVYILKGNHDAPLSGVPYWSFLSDVPGITYISEPRAIGKDLLALPYSASPKDEWRGIPIKQYKCVLMHQTVAGTDLGNGTVAEDDNLPLFPRGLRIYSGDIHTPQKVGSVVYVGAPHPVHFGDTYTCRMLRLDASYAIAEEIAVRGGVRKHMLDVRSTDDLDKVRTTTGDQVYIRFALDASSLSQWPAYRDWVIQWAQARDVLVSTCEPIVSMSRTTDAEQTSYETDPKQVLAAFCEAEKVPDKLAEVGLSILES